MNTKNQNNKLVFLFGPTAVGKTDMLSYFFAPEYEVINADSIQVYKDLSIGSAKPDKKTLKIIKHHLVDFLPCDATFNVGDFVTLADAAYNDIISRNKKVVVSGGTAFYFKNFLYGLSKTPQSDAAIRREVEDYLKDVGKEKAYAYVQEIDPVYASKIHVNDCYRISRAIEVFKQSGRPLSSFTQSNEIRFDNKPLIIGLTRDKEDLKQRIALRVDIMLDLGLEKEIEMLKAKGASLEWQSMRGIGYAEFFQYSNISEIKAAIIRNSLKYAKRQYTFFRAFDDIHWVNAKDMDTVERLLKDFN